MAQYTLGVVYAQYTLGVVYTGYPRWCIVPYTQVVYSPVYPGGVYVRVYIPGYTTLGTPAAALPDTEMP